MKLKDLKTGMRTEYRNGDIRIVYAEGKLLANNNGSYVDFSNYNKSLECLGNEEFDIMIIYDKPEYSHEIFNTKHIGKILWDRKEEKVVLTLDDVEYSESTLRSLIKKATK